MSDVKSSQKKFCFDNYALIRLSHKVTLSSNVVSQSFSFYGDTLCF